MPRTSVKKNLDAIIVERLKDKVIKGEWQSGQRIMPDDLAEEFGVSRTPVLQALRVLASERMLTIAQNGNILVPEYSRDQVADICRVRTLLETHAMERLVEKTTPDFEKLEQIADKCAEALAGGDEIESRRCDLAFHRELIKAAGNDCLSHIYTEVIGQFAVCNYLIAVQSMQKQVKAGDEHYELLALMKKADKQGAIQLLEGHIRRSRDEMLRNMDE